jgi:hypothetical protein
VTPGEILQLMTRTYVKVIALEAAILAALWIFGRAFS